MYNERERDSLIGPAADVDFCEWAVIARAIPSYQEHENQSGAFVAMDVSSYGNDGIDVSVDLWVFYTNHDTEALHRTVIVI